MPAAQAPELAEKVKNMRPPPAAAIGSTTFSVAYTPPSGA